MISYFLLLPLLLLPLLRLFLLFFLFSSAQHLLLFCLQPATDTFKFVRVQSSILAFLKHESRRVPTA